jgi:hypothetical protein
VRRKLISLPESTASGLTSLLQQAPKVLIEGTAAASSMVRMTMVFTPQVAAGLATGGLQLVPSASMDGAIHAIARDAVTKGFVEHANIVSHLNPAVAIAAVWQIAAMVTAQKYLVVIDRRLANIERGVSKIREFLEDIVAGELEGNIAYLRDRAETLREGQISPGELLTVANQLEQIDRSTRGTFQQLLRQLERRKGEFEAIQWEGTWFNANDEVKEARSKISRAEENAQMLLLASQIRLLGASFRNALGLHDAYTGRVLESLRGDIDEQERTWAALGRVIEAKLPQLKAHFQLEGTDKRQRRAVKDALSDASSRLNTEMEDAVEALRHLQEAVQEDKNLSGQPMELEIEVDSQGRIHRLEHLLPAA